MGHEKTGRRALLKRLLHIARAQKVLLAENRFADLAKTMAERDEIISSIRETGAAAAEISEETALIEEILGLDANLRVSMEGELEETRRELERLSQCNTAHRAYVSSSVKTPGKRCSRDG